jgi:hypothetical protein
MQTAINQAEESIWKEIPVKQREQVAALLSSILLCKTKENNNEPTSQNTAYTSQPIGCNLCSSILHLSGSKSPRKPKETVCLEGSGS